MRKNDIITPSNKGVEDMVKTRNEIERDSHRKTQTRYAITFHNEKDKDIIQYFEDMKSQGVSPTQIVRKILRGE